MEYLPFFGGLIGITALGAYIYRRWVHAIYPYFYLYALTVNYISDLLKPFTDIHTFIGEGLFLKLV